jgi:succinate dehydrogenase hydrophobic anchor subunit
VTGSSLPRRFLGRPKGARPGYLPPRAQEEETLPVVRVRSGRLWLVQALAGALLLAFLGVHLVAQHLLVPGGLRSFTDVVAYLRNPVALASEIGLLASVLVHAGLGLRSSLVDVIRDPRMLARASWLIAAVGVAIFGYGIWLTLRVIGAA